MEKARPVSLKEIRIRDNFWDKYRRLVREEILKYQWCAMNDQIEGAPKSHCIENFRIAAGEKQGEFYGAVFQDSDVAKWLEAVAYTLAEKPDKELKKLADSVIELIGRAQEPDGYFNTYFILKEPGQRFRNLREGHELYTLGHMIEAAVAYKRATGEKRFLELNGKDRPMEGIGFWRLYRRWRIWWQILSEWKRENAWECLGIRKLSWLL